MDSYVREVFPERLKALRDAIGASQEEMAAKLGMKRQSISLYEKGLRLPDIQVFDAICQATGCSPEYLLGYCDEINGRFTGMADRLAIDEEVLVALEEHRGYPAFRALVQTAEFWELLDMMEAHATTRALNEEDSYFRFLCAQKFEKVMSIVQNTVWNELPEWLKQAIISKQEEQNAKLEKQQRESLKRLEEHRKEEQLKQAMREDELNKLIKEKEEERFEQIKTDKFLRFQAKLNNWPAWQRYQEEAGEHDATKED